ncbi:MAG: hypothetical protein CM15mP14_4320 [Rhodospirillaceae bacterium]|nr:MAG: hypothetical protein CM15mP14_4320 [Rhodospirillaceae bacterium]
MTISPFRTGIDLGGTKIEAIVLDRNGAEVFRHRIIAPQGNYNDTIEAIAYLVNRADNEVSALTKLGIGIPGSLSPRTNLVRNANSTWLIGKPLKQDLEKILKRDVLIENDANCFAISEAFDGAGSKAHTVFGVILGTGVGAGIVIGKKSIKGKIKSQENGDTIPSRGLTKVNFQARSVTAEGLAVLKPLFLDPQ